LKRGKTENEDLLKEACRLFELEIIDEIYKVNAHLNEAISEAKDEIKKGEFLSDEEANKEIQ
jgi:hypothetical protein